MKGWTARSQAAWEEVEKELKKLKHPEKIEYLQKVFKMPPAVVNQWLMEDELEQGFVLSVCTAARTMEDAYRHGYQRGDVAVPVVLEYFCFTDNPMFYLITQKFLYELERKGCREFAFAVNTTALAKVFYGMQKYGWRVVGVEKTPIFYTGENLPVLAPAFIIRKGSEKDAE